MGREGVSCALFNIFSFSLFSSVGSNLRSFAGLEILRKPSFSLLVLPPSSRLSLIILGDADLGPRPGVFLELFLRGNPFLMSLSSRSTMQPSCSSSKGRGLPFFTPPPALAFLAASSSRFFSRAFRFASWIRNCSFSLNERKSEIYTILI